MTRNWWPFLAIMMFGVLVRAAAAQNSSLEHECATRRPVGSQEKTGAARFIAQPSDAQLLRASEKCYLTLHVREQHLLPCPDVVVFNPIEEIRLRGRVLDTLSTSVTIVDCPELRFTKQEPNPACR